MNDPAPKPIYLSKTMLVTIAGFLLSRYAPQLMDSVKAAIVDFVTKYPLEAIQINTAICGIVTVIMRRISKGRVVFVSPKASPPADSQNQTNPTPPSPTGSLPSDSSSSSGLGS